MVMKRKIQMKEIKHRIMLKLGIILGIIISILLIIEPPIRDIGIFDLPKRVEKITSVIGIIILSIIFFFIIKTKYFQKNRKLKRK